MGIKGVKTVVFTDTDNGGIIHVANIKGGVGKSTVATNLASYLSRRGPTLLVDLDVQGSATHALGQDPAGQHQSSWELLNRRFAPEHDTDTVRPAWMEQVRHTVHEAETRLFPWVVGKGRLTDLATKINPCLDLVPANADLFKGVSLLHLQNLRFNLRLARDYYKYVIIDTPSVWNPLTRTLFLHSDLNLVPVTLNALSTKSLRDYLLNVKTLASSHSHVRIRIVKNEVFGKASSKVRGKIRTMNENRRFLEGLCEQVVIRNDDGVSLLPQPLMFDLEIPDSATVRDAQDAGKAVGDVHQYSTAAKAFSELARKVQYVLNNPVTSRPPTPWERFRRPLSIGSRVAAGVLFVLLMSNNRPVAHIPLPRPIAPQQLSESTDTYFDHTFRSGESLYRVAKYAICYFRALVPSAAQVSSYAQKMLDLHNRTRLPGEAGIKNVYDIPVGTQVRFYPPTDIVNPREDELLPAYRYFNSVVKDPFAYITGDWCERGTGGGNPHYGVDVAANYGAEIISPIDGTVIVRTSGAAGRMVGVVRDGMLLFFAHMDKRYVKTGQKVTKGDALGTIGMTGRTSGPHVHIGYGLRTPSGGINFGRHRYRLTDPKLFFYREEFLKKQG